MNFNNQNFCTNNKIKTLYNLHNSSYYYKLYEKNYKNVKFQISDNLILINQNNIVKAIDLNTKKILWICNLKKKAINKNLQNYQNVNNSLIVLNDEYSIVYSLNKFTGDIIWSKKIIENVISYPIVTNDYIIMQTNNGNLYSLQRYNGNLNWKIFLARPEVSSQESNIFVTFNLIVVCDSFGRILVITENGEILWKKYLNKFNIFHINNYKKTIKKVIVCKDVIYAFDNYEISALNLISGENIWCKNFNNVQDIKIQQDNLFIIHENKNLFLLDSKTGKTLWYKKNFTLGDINNLELHNEYLIITDSLGNLYFLNKKSGSIQGFCSINKSKVSSLISVNNDLVTIQYQNGNIYLLYI